MFLFVDHGCVHENTEGGRVGQGMLRVIHVQSCSCVWIMGVLMRILRGEGWVRKCSGNAQGDTCPVMFLCVDHGCVYENTEGGMLRVIHVQSCSCVWIMGAFMRILRGVNAKGKNYSAVQWRI